MNVLRNGKLYCAGDPENFCDECRALVVARGQMRSEPEWRAYFTALLPDKRTAQVSPPPSLIERVQSARGVRPRPTLITAAKGPGGVSAPPDFVAFIKRARSGE